MSNICLGINSRRGYLVEYPVIYPAMLVGAAPKNWQEVLKTEKIIATTKKDGAWYQFLL